MKSTEDLRVEGYLPLMTPAALTSELPITQTVNDTVIKGRESIQNILAGRDHRILVIAGPCSIHDKEAAIDYARRLSELSRKVTDTLCVVMRVYFEKPRTTVGWKGLINDPNLDGTCDMGSGLQEARKILLEIGEMGLPTATEMLETITPQYVADLVSWACIGARTTESQTHREMASGLSMPVGFKNGTDGSLSAAINAIVASRQRQSFLGIDHEGRTCIVKTSGNQWGHLVLRGGRRPNYDPISVEDARLNLIVKDLPQTLVVDCSHANSMKKFQGQAIVWKSILNQRLAGNTSLVGLMLESNLFEGNQKYSPDPADMAYGVSITDECISWETTEELLLTAHKKLTGNLS
ncbi:MAG: 3-deoxy-7-phosphoheptulonate synthase [Desulfobacterales bacterium]|nr:3-deoxy-7-phosphoheptulonate synthase [Desulfobacterales bacterium]